MSSGGAVRLADSTPWVLLDVLMPGLVLLLLSQLWAMVAPGLGRKLGRWLLVLGLPGLLVASLVGHVVAPEKARALSEGIDFTAFVLCFPLGALWLVSLLYRLIRFWLGRGAPGRRPELPRTAEWLRLGLVTLPVIALVALVQWQASSDEAKAMERRASDLRTMVRALEATEAKAAEFARERAELAEKIELLHQIAPRSVALDELVTRLERLAGECGIQILEWSSTAGDDAGVLQEQQVSLVLRGDLKRLTGLLERSQKLARLVAWQRVGVRGARATALLTAYSAPDRPAAPSPDACAHPLSKVWLWPYTAKLGAARAGVDQLCGELARHATTQAQVDDFRAKKARLTQLVAAIEKVRAARSLPEVEVETEPPAEEAPLPTKRT